MDKLVNKMFGDDMIKVLNQMLDEFIELNFNQNDIYKSIKDIGESVRTCLYLIACDRGLNDIASSIDNINKKLIQENIDEFIISYNNGTCNEFLKKFNKTDKMNLLKYMDLDVDTKDVVKLSRLKQEYRNIINKSIKDDQLLEHKDGFDTFIKYKNEKATK